MRDKAIVVGAGPAGASGAISLAQAGIDVTLFEQRSRWRGRVCGGFVNPEGVGHLATLGALDAVLAAGGLQVTACRLTTTRGLDHSVSVTVDGTPGLGVPRRVLEETLLERGRESGVTVRMGVRVIGVKRHARTWTVTARRGAAIEQHAADILVVADGRFSLVARQGFRRRYGWFGWNATFEGVSQQPGALSMHFFPHGYFGVLTFSDGLSNVCGLTHFGGSAARTWDERWLDALARQPCLAQLMAHAARLSDWQGIGPLPFTSSMRQSDGPILAGDAAAVGDPYMGEGISRALGTGPILRQALAERLNEHLDCDAVRAAYQKLWKRLYTPRLRLGVVARQLQRRPQLFEGALAVLAHRPALIHAVTRVFHPSLRAAEAESRRS